MRGNFSFEVAKEERFEAILLENSKFGMYLLVGNLSLCPTFTSITTTINLNYAVSQLSVYIYIYNIVREFSQFV